MTEEEWIYQVIQPSETEHLSLAVRSTTKLGQFDDDPVLDGTRFEGCLIRGGIASAFINGISPVKDEIDDLLRVVESGQSDPIKAPGSGQNPKGNPNEAWAYCQHEQPHPHEADSIARFAPKMGLTG